MLWRNNFYGSGDINELSEWRETRSGSSFELNMMRERTQKICSQQEVIIHYYEVTVSASAVCNYPCLNIVHCIISKIRIFFQPSNFLSMSLDCGPNDISNATVLCDRLR